MPTYIALLRGINVGGRNKLPMRELTEVLKGLGLKNIKTYIQSGNIVFESGEEAELPSLAPRIKTAIRQSHGFEPEVILLSPEAFEEAIKANPYPEAEADPKLLHIFFLKSAPGNPALDLLAAIKRDNEEFALIGKYFYLHTPDGIGRSKLAAGVEKALGVQVTARNWRSVQKIMALVNP